MPTSEKSEVKVSKIYDPQLPVLNIPSKDAKIKILPTVVFNLINLNFLELKKWPEIRNKINGKIIPIMPKFVDTILLMVFKTSPSPSLEKRPSVEIKIIKPIAIIINPIMLKNVFLSTLTLRKGIFRRVFRRAIRLIVVELNYKSNNYK